MKYRIENGQITMPIEDFNKINDDMAEFEEREKRILEIEKKLLENKSNVGLSLVVEEHYQRLGVHTTTTTFEKHSYFTDLNGLLKQQETSYLLAWEEEKKIIRQKHNAEILQLKTDKVNFRTKVLNMSRKDFKQLKKLWENN